MLIERIELNNKRRAAALKLSYWIRSRALRRRFVRERAAAKVITLRWKCVMAKRQLRSAKAARDARIREKERERQESGWREAQRRAELAALEAEKLEAEAEAARAAHRARAEEAASDVEVAARRAAAEAIEAEAWLEEEEVAVSRSQKKALTREQLLAVHELRMRQGHAVSRLHGGETFINSQSAKHSPYDLHPTPKVATCSSTFPTRPSQLSYLELCRAAQRMTVMLTVTRLSMI